MKNFILLFFVMTLTSCAEKNPNHKGNPVKEMLALKDEFMAKAAKAQSFPILTKNLDLIVPNPAKRGKIMLNGEDAEKAFNALRVSPVDINDSDFYLSMNQKKGQDITCLEMISIDDTEPTTYGCELEIEYDKGSVLRQVEDVEISEKIPALQENFEGFNLVLDSSDSTKSTILLKENSALVLYSILDVSETEEEESTYLKTGENYSCKKKKSQTRDDVVTCEIFYNHENGEAKLL